MRLLGLGDLAVATEICFKNYYAVRCCVAWCPDYSCALKRELFFSLKIL